MGKVAITGSTGFVGGNIAQALAAMGFEVIGLARKASDESIPWPLSIVDFQSEESIAKALVGCSAVIHCAIHNDFNKLVNDREFAYDSFVGMTARVTRAANKVGAQTIYISSDWIMDGTSHFTKESDPGNPINFYGALKALGEQVIRDLAPESGAVCRIGGESRPVDGGVPQADIVVDTGLRGGGVADHDLCGGAVCLPTLGRGPGTDGDAIDRDVAARNRSAGHRHRVGGDIPRLSPVAVDRAGDDLELPAIPVRNPQPGGGVPAARRRVHDRVGQDDGLCPIPR